MKAEITADGMLKITADTETELFALNQWGPAPFKVDVETHEEFVYKLKAQLEKAHEADSQTAEARAEDLFFYTVQGKWSDFPFKRVPEEKIYSQADMDGAQKIIDNLINDKKTHAAREKEFLLLHQNALEEEQARNDYISRKHDALLRTCEIFEQVRSTRASVLSTMEEDLIEVKAENELLRATVQSLLNSRDNTGEPCNVAGKGS